MSTLQNPYNPLLEETKDDVNEIQARYIAHRVDRNASQKAKLLSPAFTAFDLDTILQRLEDPSLEPGFVDPRHCLVFWARPPTHLRALVAEVQRRIRTAAPKLWLMPQPNLHMTALEVTHSKTAPEITSILAKLQPSVERITNYTFNHRTRLIKPAIGYSDQGLALTFVPAAGEALPAERRAEDDQYTYHHLRRDLWELVRAGGVEVGSRYVVPSAHVTIGRFITNEDFFVDGRIDPARVKRLIDVIEETNRWLEKKYWPDAQGAGKRDGEWVVGEQFGLDCRTGTLWYGGGDRVAIGKGF